METTTESKGKPLKVKAIKDGAVEANVNPVVPVAPKESSKEVPFSDHPYQGVSNKYLSYLKERDLIAGKEQDAAAAEAILAYRTTNNIVLS